MAEVSDEALQKVTDQLRSLHNWVAVFETEYDLPGEVVQKLRGELEDVGRTLGAELL